MQIELLVLIALLALIAGTLIFAVLQLQRLLRHIQARALQERANQRITIWTDQLEKDALHSAQDKFFEHELYKRDELFPDIEELTLRERRAIMSAFNIELLYFQNLFHQVNLGAISAAQSTPLKYMRCMMDAPQRRYWKDYLRQSNHYPEDFVAHVDQVVKKFDRVEAVMDNDQDAEFEAVFLDIFDVPAPPDWVNR